MEVARTLSCKNVARVTAHTKSSSRKYLIYSVFALLYALSLPWVWQTIGEPLKRAKQEAFDLDKINNINDKEFEVDGQEEIEIDIGLPTPAKVKESLFADNDLSKSEGLLSSNIKPNNQEKNIIDLIDDLNKLNNETPAIGKTERPLPSAYLADAGPMAFLFLVVFCHSLFLLLCKWLVWFNVMAFYDDAKKSEISVGCFLHVVPFSHRGSSEICEIKKSTVEVGQGSSGSMEFIFQRQKFVIHIADVSSNFDDLNVKYDDFQVMKVNSEDHVSHLDPEVLKEEQLKSFNIAKAIGFISPLSPEVDLPLKHYIRSKGFRNITEVEKAIAKYGNNNLRTETKTLGSILINQLLSPLAIFQLFSSSLWLLDQYWQQSIFSVVMIILMEFTTAFQRHRTAQMLANLAPKPFPVMTLRGGNWYAVLSNQLLPGDIICLSANNTSNAANPNANVIPCDSLLLNGSAVVNEATLTGESVPQMKDAITFEQIGDDDKERLDANGRHRVHVLFSGTNLISTSTSSEYDDEKKSNSSNKISLPPGVEGCICYVLRTGFGSSQGELMQMIEFSTESVSGSKDTGYALLILLIFALISSGYVFKRGMEKGRQTTHELLLRCVIIITSVVPQHLPIQMAAAVNYALIALNGKGVLCTEPFRLPEAGKLTHCYFDKTGTLTSDELVPVGVINKQNMSQMEPVHKASDDNSMILAACHSLISMPEPKGKDSKKTIKDNHSSQKLLGDPIELAAVQGVQWTYNPTTNCSAPGVDVKILENLLHDIEAEHSKKPTNITQKKLDDAHGTLSSANRLKRESPFDHLKIISRFHFSSQLQRMSVIAKVHFKNGEVKSAVLMKGSPEAIKRLLAHGEKIPDYDEVYRNLAEKGMRVLALAYKYLPNGSHEMTREDAEKDLIFAGFIAFECKIRSDTKKVVTSLRKSAHKVVMMTGDATLTALHIAKQAGICTKEASLVLTDNSNPEHLSWRVATGDPNKAKTFPFAHDIPGCRLNILAKEYDLLMTESILERAELLSQGKIYAEIDSVNVFARMSPAGKAKIIRKVQEHNEATQQNKQKLVLMCGDGGNDVGALKQADIGLALLSGYGSSNTDEENSKPEKEGEKVWNLQDDLDEEKQLNELDRMEKIQMKFADKAKKAEAATIRKEIMAKQQEYYEAEMQRRRNANEPESMFGAMKAATVKLNTEVQAAHRKLDQKYSIHLKKRGGVKEEMGIYEKMMAMVDEQKKSSADPNKKPSLEDLTSQFDDAEGQVPLVRPGDASIAAPFTSRVPSIRSVVHIIRQGRCTLLSALQQQQTMMLECTISAYTMAALSLEGARQSERQLLASSWLILTAVGSFSYATPLENMHPVKPIASLFHPAVFLSTMLQAFIHLFCISYGVSIAKEAMGEDKLQEVIDFNYNASLGLDKKLAELDEETYNPIDSFLLMWQHPFKANLLNTVCFLVQTSQTMAVFFVNYKGRPWMNGLLENHALFLSLFVAIGAVAVCAWEMLPILNSLLQLEPFPDNYFRWQVMGLVIMSILGTFAVDRIVVAIFAPDVFGAMWESAKQTTFADLLPVLKSLLKGVLGFGVFASGNPVLWIGGFYAYRRYNQYLEQLEEEELRAWESKQNMLKVRKQYND